MLELYLGVLGPAVSHGSSNKISRSKSKVLRQQREIDQLRSDVEEQQSINASQRRLINKLSIQVGELTEECEELTEERHALTEECDELTQERQALTEECENLTEECKDLTLTIDEKDQKIQALRQTIRRLEKNVYGHKQSIHNGDNIGHQNAELEAAMEKLGIGREERETDQGLARVILRACEDNEILKQQLALEMIWANCQSEEIKKLRDKTAPIHLRVLLEKTKLKLARALRFEDWGQAVEKHGSTLPSVVARTFSGKISGEILQRICRPTGIQRLGNHAAHNATMDEMEQAIDIMPSELRKEMPFAQEMFNYLSETVE